MNEILEKSVFFGMFLTLLCYQIGDRKSVV